MCTRVQVLTEERDIRFPRTGVTGNWSYSTWVLKQTQVLGTESSLPSSPPVRMLSLCHWFCMKEWEMFLNSNFKVDFLTSTCAFKRYLYCNKKVYDNALTLKNSQKEGNGSLKLHEPWVNVSERRQLYFKGQHWILYSMKGCLWQSILPLIFDDLFCPLPHIKYINMFDF